MRTVFAVFLLFITYVASYPSFREAATDNDENENNFELKLRSILNHLSNEKNDDEHMTRSLASENNYESDDDADDYLFSKRQGGHNIVDKQSKCEIECIYTQRHPQTGKGKSIKDAAKACRQMCPNTSKRRSGNKTGVQKTDKNKKFNQRQLSDDDSSEEQNNQRREFYDFLLDQIQRNNNE